MTEKDQQRVASINTVWQKIKQEATKEQKDEIAKTFLTFIGLGKTEIDAFSKNPLESEIYRTFKRRYHDKKEAMVEIRETSEYFWLRVDQIFPAHFSDEELLFLIEDGIMAVYLFLVKLTPLKILEIRGQLLDPFLVRTELELLEKSGESLLMALVNLASYNVDPPEVAFIGVALE